MLVKSSGTNKSLLSANYSLGSSGEQGTTIQKVEVLMKYFCRINYFTCNIYETSKALFYRV